MKANKPLNRNKSDNRIENLKLLTIKEHSFLHSLEREKDIKGRFI